MSINPFIPKSKRRQTAGQAAPKRLSSKKQEKEFWKGEKEFMICPECEAVYYDKAWHDSLEGDMKHHKKNWEEMPLSFRKLCPACKMKKDKVYEGETIVKLKTKNEKLKTEILNNIKNTEKDAREWDIMDRILWQEEKEDGLHIYTSDNQLAVRIGKNLDKAFKGGKLEIKYSHKEDVARVVWEAPI